MERADQVLALGQVDAGLAADRGVDLGDEGRRHVHDRDPAQVRRREEARGVAQRPATDRHDRLRPFDAQACQFAGRLLDDGKSLGVLALRQQHPLHRPALGGKPVGDRRPRRGPRTGLRHEDRALRPDPPQRLRGLGDRDALAEHVAADLRLRVEQPRGGGAWRIDGRLDGVEHPMDLRHAVDADRGRGIEPLTLGGQVTHRRDRVPADDQRPHVRRAPQSLGEHLRPAVEPDREPAAIQRPAVAWVDDGPTAGRHHAGDAG